MVEYLVKRVDGDWFDLSRENFAETLRPRMLESHAISGWGDHRIVAAGVEISFSFEQPGIHVVFEGEIAPTEADRIITEICENISEKTGQEGFVIAL